MQRRTLGGGKEKNLMHFRFFSTLARRGGKSLASHSERGTVYVPPAIYRERRGGSRRNKSAPRKVLPSCSDERGEGVRGLSKVSCVGGGNLCERHRLCEGRRKKSPGSSKVHGEKGGEINLGSRGGKGPGSFTRPPLTEEAIRLCLGATERRRVLLIPNYPKKDKKRNALVHER